MKPIVAGRLARQSLPDKRFGLLNDVISHRFYPVSATFSQRSIVRRDKALPIVLTNAIRLANVAIADRFDGLAIRSRDRIDPPHVGGRLYARYDNTRQTGLIEENSPRNPDCQKPRGGHSGPPRLR
jgi:hypothetical protein